jgi:signal transduction histidine kinase
MEKIKILYVDDEENNLHAFRSFFRKEYTIYTAESALEALILLEKNEINIIISDQRMPETTGVEFLEKTVETHPVSIRMLITGQSDLEVVIAAINNGQITKYVQKPWDWEKLSLSIENCVLLYRSRVELKLTNKALQKANNELNKFVYSLSHDLRSPLMSILGILHVAKTSKEKLADTDYLGLIEKSVTKLDLFIRNIIDYYKNSRVELISETIDFTNLCAGVFEALRNQDTGIDFQTEIDQQNEFFGDVLTLKIILNNLVSNAIKYQNLKANKRFVKIKVVVQKDFALVSVSDNGVGIEEKHLEKIFDQFFRTDTALKKEGTGLGLYIVKEALEKINGKIKVSSQPTFGSSFDLTIPNKKTEDK